MVFVKELQAVNPKTFRIVLTEPTGLVLSALGKPSSNVPFMMPKRVADTDPSTQISDFIGSGPFVFKKDEWKAGDKAVYVKFAQYKPRSEPPQAWPAARWPRWTGQWRGSRITRPRSTRSWPARSTTSRRRPTTSIR
jgi:ABC-type transport system substrate-binding protein